LYASDIAALEGRIGRDLSAWKQPVRSSPVAPNRPDPKSS